LGYERTGFSIFSFVQYRNSPQDDCYGIGSDSRKENRTNFRLQDIKAGGVLSIRPFSTIRIFLLGTYLKNKISSGTSDDIPSIKEKFNRLNSPGLSDHTEFYVGSAGIFLDFRSIKLKNIWH